MLRIAVALPAFIAFILLGLWNNQLRDENHSLRVKMQQLEKTAAEDRANYEKLYYEYIREQNLIHHGSDSKEKALADVQAQSESAKKRLQELTRTLTELKATAGAPGVSAADAHIAEDDAAIKKLSTELQQLSADGTTVRQRSQAYRQEQERRRQAANQNLATRAQVVQASLRDLRAQIQYLNHSKDPERKQRISELNHQIDGFKSEQDEIAKSREQLKRGGSSMNQAINQEVNQEQGEMGQERDQLQHELAQKKSDLDYWKKMKSAPGGHDQQIKDMEKEIAQQRDKIAVLDRLLQSLKMQ